MFVVESITPGMSDHIRGRTIAPDRFIFMLVAGIGELDAERADVRLIKNRQNGFERNIVQMRPLPISPAAVQPDAFAGNPFDALIERRDMLLGRLHELLRRRDRGKTWRDPWRDRANRSGG